MTQNTINAAIESSIRENQIVTLTDTLDCESWVCIATGLSALCDDWTEQQVEGVNMREYWGVDEDGDAWRVHLIGTKVS